jgi:serine/threonine protein kinase
MHKRQFLHRDVKPSNFLMGIGDLRHIVHIVDLGLAKRYQDSSGNHIPYCDGKKLAGTARYTSIRTHMGIEQSRRDDLEGLGYVLMYFNIGSLPWQGVSAPTKQEKYDKIKDMKVKYSFDMLCKGYPDEFAVFFKYCHNLSFDEAPDYGYIKRLLSNLLKRQHFKRNYIYDWDTLSEAVPKAPSSVSTAAGTPALRTLPLEEEKAPALCAPCPPPPNGTVCTKIEDRGRDIVDPGTPALSS